MREMPILTLDLNWWIGYFGGGGDQDEDHYRKDV